MPRGGSLVGSTNRPSQEVLLEMRVARAEYLSFVNSYQGRIGLLRDIGVESKPLITCARSKSSPTPVQAANGADTDTSRAYDSRYGSIPGAKILMCQYAAGTSKRRRLET